MATFYLDLYAGNDANNGLSAAAPKLTLNAATNLVDSVDDEVRVRGKDNLYTSVGNWVWTNYGTSIVYNGADKTGDIPAGTYVCKTVTGSNVPEIYKVASVTYAGGNTTAVIVDSVTWNAYIGDTSPTGGTATSKLTSTPTVAAQTIAKQGYYSGTVTDYSGRTFCKITGGWDAAYTAQTSQTICYHSGTTTDFLAGTARQYWEMSEFIVLGYRIQCNHTYHNRKNSVWAYCVGTTTPMYVASCYFYNVFMNGHKKDELFALQTCLVNNSKFLNTTVTGNVIVGGTSTGNGNAVDCIFGLAFNDVVVDSNSSDKTKQGNFTNCKFYQKNYDFTTTNANFYNYINCEFYDIGTTNGTSYVFNSAALIKNCLFNVNINKTGAGLGGATYGGGLFYNCTGLTFCTNAYVPLKLIIYNTINENLNISNVIGLVPINTNDYETPIGGVLYKNNSIIYQASGNTIFSQYGYTTLSTDYYTGKTNGTNSILHVVGTNNAECDFTSVDMVVNAASGYSLSFYAKGSGSYTLHWNILNGGEYLYAWQTQAITSGGWQQITKSIVAGDWNMSGTATLVIRIPSQAKGTFAKIDYITLT